MNHRTAEQVIKVQVARTGIFNAWSGNTLLAMVDEDDRGKLIPYIDEEIEKAELIGTGARMYSHELKHLKAMLEAEND